MSTLAPLPPDDVGRIVDSALAGLDLKLSVAGERDVIANLEKSLRFDHDRKRFIIVDDAGNPRVTVDSTGNVHDVGLDHHLRSIASTKPAAFTGDVREGTSANPFVAGATYNRTRQAMLTRSGGSKSDESGGDRQRR